MRLSTRARNLPPDSMIRLTEGRVLYVDEKSAWTAVGRRLLKSSDGGRSWYYRAALPLESWREWTAEYRIARRLTRSGYHHLVLTGEDSGIVIANGSVYRLRASDPEMQRVSALHGSRPLSLCFSGGHVYYGEYRSNRERSPVSIWVSTDGTDWEPVWSFRNVRHIHGVFPDPCSSSIWVTTGDEDHESMIWKTDDSFRTVEPVVGGCQSYRAVQLLFTPEFVYWGSDAPHEENHIFRLDRSSGRVETLARVKGPVFYGYAVGGWLFFSTVVEPSRVNLSRYAEVWATPDGHTWRVIQRFRKDPWPMRYFQYGQVLFPAGPSDGVHLWCTPLATELDQHSLTLPIPVVQDAFSRTND